MQPRAPATPPKPVSQIWRPELTRLPRLHWARRAFRGLARLLARGLIRGLTRPEVRGLEHLPAGAALFAINHLGDADTPLLLSALPFAPETLGKIELLFEYPVLGRLMDWYGIIWLHRGLVDRRALDFGVQALREGRSVVVAPEGRYALSEGLERGTGGAAYLALRAQVPIVPVALTGTQNHRVFAKLRRMTRPSVTLTVGEPFRLHVAGGRAQTLQAATQEIMESIARLLPPEYRGVYGEQGWRA